MLRPDTSPSSSDPGLSPCPATAPQPRALRDPGSLPRQRDMATAAFPFASSTSTEADRVSGSWLISTHTGTSWQLALSPCSTHTWDRERDYAEVAKKGFNKKIGQTVVIQYMASSNKHSDWPHFICDQYLSLPYISPSLFPLLFPPIFYPLPFHECSLIGLFHPAASPPHHFEPSGFHPYWLQCPFPVFMQFDSPSISVTDKVCFLVFSLLCQVCVVSCIAYLIFLIIPLDKALN